MERARIIVKTEIPVIVKNLVKFLEIFISISAVVS
jgi:hypothetical protein